MYVRLFENSIYMGDEPQALGSFFVSQTQVDRKSSIYIPYDVVLDPSLKSCLHVAFLSLE